MQPQKESKLEFNVNEMNIKKIASLETELIKSIDIQTKLEAENKGLNIQ